MRGQGSTPGSPRSVAADVDDDVGEVLVLQDELFVALLELRILESAFEATFDVEAILWSKVFAFSAIIVSSASSTSTTISANSVRCFPVCQCETHVLTHQIL